MPLAFTRLCKDYIEGATDDDCASWTEEGLDDDDSAGDDDDSHET